MFVRCPIVATRFLSAKTRLDRPSRRGGAQLSAKTRLDRPLKRGGAQLSAKTRLDRPFTIFRPLAPPAKVASNAASPKQRRKTR